MQDSKQKIKSNSKNIGKKNKGKKQQKKITYMQLKGGILVFEPISMNSWMIYHCPKVTQLLRSLDMASGNKDGFELYRTTIHNTNCILSFLCTLFIPDSELLFLEMKRTVWQPQMDYYYLVP